MQSYSINQRGTMSDQAQRAKAVVKQFSDERFKSGEFMNNELSTGRLESLITAALIDAASPVLVWSTEKPTVPGAYWWRAGAHVHNPKCMHVVALSLWNGKLVNSYTLDTPDEGEYAGPLHPPQEGGAQ